MAGPLKGFRCRFPTQRNRELFRRNRNFRRWYKELHLAKPKSSAIPQRAVRSIVGKSQKCQYSSDLGNSRATVHLWE
jgi:hypothetical protein